MRLPSVQVEVAGLDGPVLCYPGTIVGRHAAARIRLQQPEISELHAHFSLRGGALWLIYLRRPVHIDGVACWEIPVTGRAVLPLTEQIVMLVRGEWVPDEMPALQVDEGTPKLLDGECSLLPDGSWVDGHQRAALAQAWWSDDAAWLRVGDRVEAVYPDARWEVGERRLAVRMLPWPGAGWTRALRRPPRTRVRTSRSMTRVDDELGREVELVGNASVVFYALATWAAAQQEPAAPWLHVATALWGAKEAPQRRGNLRTNVLHRLDQTLRQRGLRDDLVRRDDGFLWLGDRVEVQIIEGDAGRD